jgi:hypothetical protein
VPAISDNIIDNRLSFLDISSMSIIIAQN